MAVSTANGIEIVDINLLPLPSSLDLPTVKASDQDTSDDNSFLPQLPPVNISGREYPTNLDEIISSLPPPIPITDAEYGPSSSTEPQLEPLMTEDGEIPKFDEMNAHYEFVRRTLSHSRRRYSARFKRPRPKSNATQPGEGQSSLDFPGKGREPEESSLDAPNRTRSPPSTTQHPLHVQHGQRDRNKAYSARRPPQKEKQQRVGHASERRANEPHVDNQGRTFYMDHSNHTVNYNDTETTQNERGGGGREFDARREMLNRRYQSLQRSFRTAHHRRRDPTHEDFPANLTPIESVGAISYMPLESEDAGDHHGNAAISSSERTAKNRKSKTNRSWFTFGRKSRTVTQSSSSITDNMIPVNLTTPTQDIFSPLTPPPTLDDLGVSLELSTSAGNNNVAADIERSSVGLDALIAVVDSTGPHPPRESLRNSSSQRVSRVSQTGSDTEQRSNRTSGGSAVVTDLDQAAAAAVLQQRTSRRISRESRGFNQQQEGDTDDETNEVVQSVRVSSSDEIARSEDGIDVKEHDITVDDERKDISFIDQQKLTDGLKESPALKFITRSDLYTYLNSTGVLGEAFFSQRALMELVQRIRADNNLFVKYQHSHHLVEALNKFAQQDKELPQGWEKKLNKQGKVFFIDHNYQLTTFIDPRLPEIGDSPNKSSLSPQLSVPIIARRMYSTSDEPEIRPHHSTVVHTQSVPSQPSQNSQPPDTVNQLTSSNEISYEEQVVAFFRQSNIEEKVSQRYRRGVRPQMREAIEDIRRNGVSALERVQLSGGGLALEMTLILSMFEEEISTMTPASSSVPQISVNDTNASGQKVPAGSGTIQRQKQAFAAKLQTFKLQLARLGFAQGSRLKFNIRRDHLLEDAYEHVMKSEIRHLQRKRLNIAFKGEEGLDYGGPSREFFFLLSRNVFNPYYGLFEYSANDTYTIQISPTSSFIQNNLDWFRFAGRIVGLVIAQGFLLDVFFSRPFYKSILGKPSALRDLESLEPAFYNSLLWIQENDPEPLDLTFTIEEEAFGQLTMHELKEGGADTPVLEDNKHEYIDLMVQWRLDRGMAEQMQAFMKGCSEIMPRSLLQQFDSHELEFLIAGTLEIDVDDWKNNTDYRNGYHADHPVILWFWQAVEMFDNEQRLRLLQFVTGTSSVPIEGFKALRGSSGPKKFTIDFFNEIRSLPRSHTCFNRLDLPPYPTFEILFEKLRTAIEEGGTFGIE